MGTTLARSRLKSSIYNLSILYTLGTNVMPSEYLGRCKYRKKEGDEFAFRMSLEM